MKRTVLSMVTLAALLLAACDSGEVIETLTEQRRDLQNQVQGVTGERDEFRNRYSRHLHTRLEQLDQELATTQQLQEELQAEREELQNELETLGNLPDEGAVQGEDTTEANDTE